MAGDEGGLLVKAVAFQQVGWANRWLVWLCSMARPVLVGHPSGASVEVWKRGRKRRLFAAYNEKLCIEHTAWRFYRRFYRGGEPRSFIHRSQGLELDLAPCLLKAVADELIAFVAIRVLSRRLGSPRPNYYGKLLWPDEGPARRRGGLIAACHAVSTWLDEFGGGLVRLGVQMIRIGSGLVGTRRESEGLNTLWLGAMPTEYGRFGQKRSFYWPDKMDSRLRSLYILPRDPSPDFAEVLAQDGVGWVSQFQMLRYCPRSQILLLAMRLALSVYTLIKPVRSSWILRARLWTLHVEAWTWWVFAQAVRPDLALTTPSTWTSTRPNLVALRRAGVKTAVWHYSANVISFQHPGGRHYFNGRLRTVHEAQRIYVWNEYVARWHRENLCHNPRNEVRVVGPVMCGDASLCRNRRPPVDGQLHIAVFDISLPAESLRSVVGEPHLPMAYHEAFWRDVHRILRDCPWVNLILKPKRSMKSALHVYPEAARKLIQDRGDGTNSRIEIIEDDADPYEAIARCHLALTMPFTSPALVAWHFGRIGVYYDPTGLIGPHRFQGLGPYFCKSYDALLELLRDARTRYEHGREVELPCGLREFVGPERGQNPQQTLVRDLCGWVWGASEPVVADSRLRETVLA